ncbi:hypothetical protein CEE45_14915 [Candidatus Heimdallarchaeota archaeon B3_Heim]|nr:MAG: hypothetical protein CEE45_14915 [Candidatus Heimdallarchaeota archaeon B3_Heim]
MSDFEPSSEKQQQIHDRVRAIILQSGDKITANVRVVTGLISDTRLKQIRCFTGAGGKTYVIEAALSTSLAGEIDGGIVLKFANDLEAEVSNAERLARHLTIRQRDWESWKENHDLPLRIRRYPDHVFSPQVIQVIPEVKALLLEFLSGFNPLIQHTLEPNDRWGYAGYALARLHGSEQLQTSVQLYNPLFKLLKQYIDERYIDYWIAILEQSKGGVEFIHGDSHMSNILVSPASIAWIDSIMLPKLDRMDDIGYILSHVVQEEVAKNISIGIDIKTLSSSITRSWVPLILTTYKQTYDISQIYSRLPIDFFLGSHLIIRAGLWEKNIADILVKLGQHFIHDMPVSKLLEE